MRSPRDGSGAGWAAAVATQTQSAARRTAVGWVNLPFVKMPPFERGTTSGLSLERLGSAEVPDGPASWLPSDREGSVPAGCGGLAQVEVGVGLSAKL